LTNLGDAAAATIAALGAKCTLINKGHQFKMPLVLASPGFRPLSLRACVCVCCVVAIKIWLLLQRSSTTRPCSSS
jgi:hypothetical protein